MRLASWTWVVALALICALGPTSGSCGESDRSGGASESLLTRVGPNSDLLNGFQTSELKDERYWVRNHHRTNENAEKKFVSIGRRSRPGPGMPHLSRVGGKGLEDFRQEWAARNPLHDGASPRAAEHLDAGVTASEALEWTPTSRPSRALLQESASCPLKFQRMGENKWFAETCKTPNAIGSDGRYNCCRALDSAWGQAQSLYLQQTGFFRVENVAIVEACVGTFTSQLRSMDIDTDMIIPRCYPPADYSRFAESPSGCQGIMTSTEFDRLAGPSEIDSSLNASCSGRLKTGQECGPCIEAANAVIEVLTRISANSSDCLYYTLFYAAGISNRDGPWDRDTANCLLAVDFTGSESDDHLVVRNVVIGVASALAASAVASAVVFWLWRRRRNAVHRAFIERHTRLLKPAMTRPNTGLIEFSFEEIKAATCNFSSANYVGCGGFGDVYRGVLDDGLLVAIKRMKNCSADGDADFINEVNAINGVRHRNLVILRGCCVTSTDADGHQRLLVFDYVVNGSLQDYLFGRKKEAALTWPDRRRIAIGMAKGIAYLHEAKPAVIHRDIKASNVLLDETLNAKVADFGLAKFGIEGQSNPALQKEEAVAGTLGYVAPEYSLYGLLSEKSDVYSFGVVLLELMSRRSAALSVVVGDDDGDGNGKKKHTLITDWAWAKVKEGKLMEVLDSSIRKAAPRDILERFVLVAILCSHMLVAFRPSMNEALKYLEGDVPLPRVPNRPLPINEGFSSPNSAAAAFPPVAIGAHAPEEFNSPDQEESS